MIITRAAIMFSNGEIVEAHDYSSATIMAAKFGLHGEKIHGFMTSTGEFILQPDAAKIAESSGQAYVSGTLEPEDIWPEVLREYS